jgi:deoxyribonuclease-4
MSSSPPALGSHLTVAGKLDTVPARAAALGAASVQVFLGNPRGWALTAGDPVTDAAFRRAAEERSLQVLVHAPYLVNLGSPTPLTYERSRASLAHAVRRGRETGAAGIVVHTGSSVAGNSREAALRQVREALLPLLDDLRDSDPRLLLEPTAGQGRSLCAAVDDLGPYLDALERHPRAQVCLDTCHAFAAGHDLSVAGGMTATLDRLVEVAGPGTLAAIHANDSLDRPGSFLDRHARIGTGRIGLAPFGELLTHPAVAGLPVVLETPGGPEAYAADIATLAAMTHVTDP